MTFILLVVIIWLIAFFIILPIGNKVPKKVIKGHADSAPAKHYLGYKITSSFIIALILASAFKSYAHKLVWINDLMNYL